MIAKRSVIGRFLSVFLAGCLFFGSTKLSAQTSYGNKPTNPEKFELQAEDTSKGNRKLEGLCRAMYKTPDNYTRYFDKTEYVPLKTNKPIPITNEYIRITTRVGYNNRNLRILVGVDDQRINDGSQIKDVYLWLISTSKESSLSQYALVSDKQRKTAEILKVGEEVCKGEYCENLFSAGDRIVDYSMKKLGFKRKEDYRLILDMLDFRVATRGFSEAQAAKIQDASKGRTYISAFRLDPPPIRMASVQQVKAYESIFTISGSEPYGLVILTYGSKAISKGILGELDLDSEPYLKVIYFDFNLRK